MRVSSSGQKVITAENIGEPDPRILCFVEQKAVWINRCTRLDVAKVVPENVARLIEIATGSVIYSWYYYPLLSIGVEQCYRSLEAAIRERCRQLEIPTEIVGKNGKGRPVPMGKLIGILEIRQRWTSKNTERWSAGRKMRNFVSHPEDQNIITPGAAIEILEVTIQTINELFQ